jgi:hypothetical protein
LDSGLTIGPDTSSVIQYDNAWNFSTVTDNTQPKHEHGNKIAYTFRSSFTGMARGSPNFRFFKVTTGSDRAINRYNILRSLWYIAKEETGTPAKILSLSFNIPAAQGDFMYWSSLNCAFEILYKQGFSIFVSAGNSGYLVNERNPYIFVVGAVEKTDISPTSNYGDWVDIFAPAYFGSPVVFGTSLSTPMVAAVGATIIGNNLATLANNPGLVYQVLRDNARTDMFTDPNLAFTKYRAGNRVIRFTGTENPALSTVTAPTANYCAEFGVTASTSDTPTQAAAKIQTVITAVKPYPQSDGDLSGGYGSGTCCQLCNCL